MSNPTTPFGWQMPTATDLVTDLPADFEVFGQAVATSMADLLGGTTGQILAKNSATDMDFVWIANDQGDITGVTATTPLTGGGTSGAITVGIQDALTTQKGAVQLSDSTSTTSSVLAATPTAVKTAYDLANTANTKAQGDIPKSTVTTAGDIIYATGSAAVTRLGIGTAGQVLTVAAGVPSWATVSGGGFTYAAYTPTFTNFTLGNGTINVARWAQSGKMVHVYGQVTLGSTSSVTGNITLSLPATASSSIVGINCVGNVTFGDDGVGSFGGFARLQSTTTLRLDVLGASGTYTNILGTSATVPMTWTNLDDFRFSLVYEAA